MATRLLPASAGCDLNREDDDAQLAHLRERVQTLETLCAGIYVAGVDLGLPQRMLNALWTVAGGGNEPRGYSVDVHAGPRPVASKAADPPMPGVRLIHRPDASGSPRPEPVPLLPLPVRKTVLVVDDDPMMREVLVRILARENYEVIVASGGPEALGMINIARVDLLITDYLMPEMHGRELANHVRQRWGAVPVLYQTGFSDILFEDRRELEDGAAFLEKPFTARGLIEAARFSLFGTLNPCSA